MKRKSMSKSKRFEIFKRDNLRCVYCGNTALQSPLRVDHVIAVANGGTDDPANLVTACHECNAGKSATPLEKKKFGAVELTEEIEDRAELVRLYLDVQKRNADAIDEAANPVREYWEQRVGTLSQEMSDRLGKLVQEWPIEKLHEAIQITARKLGRPGESFHARAATEQTKYFSGILRRWRAERDEIIPVDEEPPQPPVEVLALREIFKASERASGVANYGTRQSIPHLRSALYMYLGGVVKEQECFLALTSEHDLGIEGVDSIRWLDIFRKEAAEAWVEASRILEGTGEQYADGGGI